MPRNIHAVINAQQRVRNQPGGYWVAQVDPVAAEHARTGIVSARDAQAALVLSDGAARAVVDFRTHDWLDLLAEAKVSGPPGVIALSRSLERQDPACERWPRYKASDDASAILCRFGESGGT